MLTTYWECAAKVHSVPKPTSQTHTPHKKRGEKGKHNQAPCCTMSILPSRLSCRGVSCMHRYKKAAYSCTLVFHTSKHHAVRGVCVCEAPVPSYVQPCHASACKMLQARPQGVQVHCWSASLTCWLRCCYKQKPTRWTTACAYSN